MELEPIAVNAKKIHTAIIKENLGKSRGRITLRVRSSKMNGKTYTISRRYGESATVKDESGAISSFTTGDILPEIEIYGQNEIYEIAQDGNARKQLLNRFIEGDYAVSENKIKETIAKLIENRKVLLKAKKDVSIVEDELSKLPKLEEQVKQFKSLGLEDKLKIIPLLEKEKMLEKRIDEEELRGLGETFSHIPDILPETTFLSDKALENLPHSEIFRKIKSELDVLKIETEQTLTDWNKKFELRKTTIKDLIALLHQGIESENTNLEKIFKELPSAEGKSGRELGVEYQNLLKEIEIIKPKKESINTRTRLVDELQKTRKSLLDELSEYGAARTAQLEKSIHKLNKKLKNKLKIIVKSEENKQDVIEFLLTCRLEGVAVKRLEWLNHVEEFSPVKLAELIQDGEDSLIKMGWGMTPTVATALVKLPLSKILELQELVLSDRIEIQLNISHVGEANFRAIENLSTGQQCTAILHLLLMQNKDPLIMDQPEDNLDNAFIADRIVAELRDAKLNRQFLFATHNANIPVFGDAEWIGVFDVADGIGCIPKELQGAIDTESIREKAANILEGGKIAFNQRKVKYGY